ncbi:MAG: DUF4870 domain-containing protein [Zunongwangia sp.]|jgi:uncharacterized Tic20 family protein|uniref:DUF4870 domain-containing protein n=2 Tax=Zunongwangia profunda TaxID=398743 RepID=D5B975_ZUNPS|nr:conserved hypothetical protein [Zunongwangia profunda SM-A87]MAC65102.1 DUF4870 domain-containing protein [Flavobacteriaceae bacterium]MAG86860.1 DUF4870 domain-containing protein [Flavobacteriaceae bacterium]MAO36607.1 DUF4870 domain-containing protein [Zunongwangia sp.]MAS69206.1 DUF4870 domain-containing protein [Zunongwangia sp.]|tara:strand:- start:6242 stop:6598 length:357 start_codon:yes stop_codon:yes gene_type:complete
METYSAMREDRQMLMIMHLSQLLDFVTGIGGFIVPLILWATQKDKIQDMDEQGKEIINFQISLFIYSIVCIPLIFLFGLGFLFLILVGILGLIFPIINAIKASNGEPTNYPMTIRIIQ